MARADMRQLGFNWLMHLLSWAQESAFSKGTCTAGRAAVLAMRYCKDLLSLVDI